jgi:hypothetical protein
MDEMAELPGARDIADVYEADREARRRAEAHIARA